MGLSQNENLEEASFICGLCLYPEKGSPVGEITHLKGKAVKKAVENNKENESEDDGDVSS